MIDTKFGFDLFHVDNCRSKGDHNDSDWLHLTIINGQTFFPTETVLIGDNLHAGDEVHSLLVGPFRLDETQVTTAIFGVENKSHSDSDDQQKEALSTSLAIDAGLAGVSGGILAITGELGGAAAAAAGQEATAAALKEVLTQKIAGLVFGIIAEHHPQARNA